MSGHALVSSPRAQSDPSYSILLLLLLAKAFIGPLYLVPTLHTTSAHFHLMRRLSAARVAHNKAGARVSRRLLQYIYWGHYAGRRGKCALCPPHEKETSYSSSSTHGDNAYLIYYYCIDLCFCKVKFEG